MPHRLNACCLGDSKLLLPQWDSPAWMAAAQHIPSELYSVSCVTSSNPDVPTALHPLLCSRQLPVLKLPTQKRGGCLLHSALDERVPVLLSPLVHQGDVYVVQRRDAEQAIVILAPVLAKVYEKLMEMKGRSIVVNGQLQVALEQGGFMANRSTFDSVFLVECVRDAQIAASRPLYAAFLDMKKAFDSVNHKKLLRVRQEQPGVDGRWIRALHNILANRQMKLSDVYVSMLQGTAQGSPISPLLFIAFINPLIERLRACTGVRLTDDRIIRGLFFADDICLLAESIKDMRRMLAICEEWAQEFGMTFNAGKSEMMQLAGRINQQRPEVLFAGGVLKWSRSSSIWACPSLRANASGSATRAAVVAELSPH